MADNDRAPQTPFLKRWSQRKVAASREGAAPLADAAKVVSAVPAPLAASPPTNSDAVAPTQEPPLPPVESLSFESDFAAFMRPNVDPSLKRQALHKLFADPHFNVMDGLDTYIEDYGKFVPMSPELVASLNHAKFLFDPPKTRVNDQGHVEDVPDEPVAPLDADGVDTEASGDAEALRTAEPAPDPLADAAVPVPAASTAGPRQ